MADASLGYAVLRTKLDATGLKAGLQQAKSETQKFSVDASTAIKGLGAAFGTIASSRGLAAYIGFMRSAAVEANQAATATALFEKAVRRNNESVGEGASMVQRLSDRFGVAASVIEDSATTMLRQGATLEMVEKTLLTAGASAAAAGVDIATSFDNVSTAVVSGNSVLLRSSGIIAGLGEAERAYAKTVGKTVEQLTDQERMQARVNAIYQETRYEIEDLDQILKGLPRVQAEVTRQTKLFRETAGDLALKVITPLTQGLGEALRVFNSLPTPVKNAGIAMTGAAVAGTALATGIVAIKAALSGLSGLGLLSFGPAGWVVLGVTAVVGLAAALAGANSDSLTSGIDKARKAIGSGNKDSMTGALDELITQVNGPVKEALQGMRDDLVATGDVGVEQAQRMLTEMAKAQLDARRTVLGLSLFGPSPLGDALATGGALLGTLDLKEQVRAALDSNELLKAIDLLQDAIVAMTEAGLDPRRSQPLVDFLGQIGSIPNFQFTPAPAGTTPPPVTPPPTGSTDAAKRVMQDVLDELDAAGKAAMRRAAFEGTTAATVDAAKTRVALIERAITELLTDFYGEVTKEELEGLRARRAAAQAVIDSGGLGPVFNEWADHLNAEVGRFGQTLMTRYAPDRTLGPVFTEWADHLDDEMGRLKLRLQTGLTRTVLPRPLVAEPRASVAGQFGAITGVDLTSVTSSLTAQLGPAIKGVFGQWSDYLDDEVARQAQRMAAMDKTTTNADRAIIAEREHAKALEEQAAATRNAASAATQLLLSFGQMERWSAPGALEAFTRQALIKSYGITPDQLAFGSGYQGFRSRQDAPGDLANADRINRDREAAARTERESADRFASTVVTAGFDFGNAAIKAFQDGDVVGVIRAGLGGAGSIVGGMDLGGLSFLGGTIGIGSLIAGGLGLLGTLIGALAGGGGSREAESRRRQELDRARSVPAININFNVSQQNTYNGAPRDPANEQAFARQADQLFESIYRRYLGPRLDSIERKLGMAGA